MGNGQVILILLLLMVGILGFIAAFAGNRRLKSKRMVVKDLQNPNNPLERFYARFDKNKDMIYLYSNLFKPFKDSVEPPFNLKAYVEGGVIKAVRGSTGNPEDRNIVPVRSWPLVGRTGSREFGKEMSEAIVNTLNFINLCKPFKIGQEVQYANKHRGHEILIKGVITNIGYGGIQIEHEVPFTTKEGLATSKKEILALEEFAQIAKLINLSPPETLGRLHDTPLGNFFDENWVVTNFGVIPVDDVNAVLESEKSMVAQYNSNIDSRRYERMSWAARHGPELLIITFFMVALIGGIIYMNSVNANITSQIASIHGSNTVASTTPGYLQGVIPKVNTQPS